MRTRRLVAGLAVSALLFLLAHLAWRSPGDSPVSSGLERTEESAPAPLLRGTATATATATVRVEAEEPEMARVGAPDRPNVEWRAMRQLTLEILVLDEDGRPVPGIHVYRRTLSCIS